MCPDYLIAFPSFKKLPKPLFDLFTNILKLVFHPISLY